MFEAEYEAEKASSHEKGTVVRAKITENETSLIFDDDDKITVVQVEASSVAIRPSDFRNRHIYGICERVLLSWRPNAVDLKWNNNGNGKWASVNIGYREFVCEDHSCQIILNASIDSVSHDVTLSCVEPSSVTCNIEPAFLQKLGLGHGDAGDVGLDIIFTVHPTTVSFNNVRIKELSSTIGTHTGYFALPGWENFWYHTPEHGADKLVVLNEDNDGIDEAYIGYCEAPWSSGHMTWEIPASWQPPVESGSSKPMVQFATYKQQFWITADGYVTVSKFGHAAHRGTNTVKKINGVIVE